MSERQIAYFDNAATTYKKPTEVHDFMREFYSANSVNIGRGNHDLLSDGQKMIDDTRKMLLSLFHATSAYTAAFTSTATEALNVIIQGQSWKEGQIIYISPFEHNAVYRTVKHIEREKGVKVIELAVDKDTLSFAFDRINRQFADNQPTFVIVSHVSNVCGNIAPIEQLGKLAKEYGATFAVDCAQSAGLLETDIIKNRADYMVFAGHKTLYAAFGCSGFICKKTTSLKPLIYGGTGIDSANEFMPSDLPTRFEAGSTNIMAIAGLYAALKWHNQVGIEKIREREAENYQKLLSVLKSFDGIQLIGNPVTATSIVSCIFKDLPVDAVERVLSQEGVIVRSGLQCAPLAHKFLGTYPAGTVRFSVSYFTSVSDFSALKDKLSLLS
jgi:cysteine desulfurase family protein